MACATLKRALDWESVLGGQPAKRRRCSPISPSQRERAVPSTSSSPPSTPKSAFPDVIGRKFTPEYMAESIKAELKRMQRRRHLEYGVEKMENSDSSSSENSDSPVQAERALFTFKQVADICERMLRERESEIREEYDNVLSAKLAEQYDAFVKFTYDQIHRNFNTAPSYLS